MTHAVHARRDIGRIHEDPESILSIVNSTPGIAIHCHLLVQCDAARGSSVVSVPNGILIAPSNEVGVILLRLINNPRTFHRVVFW